MPLPDLITLALHTRTAEVVRIEAALAGLVARGLPAPVAADARLVLEEAFTNIVKYAHADGGSDHPVHLRLARHADRLEIELVDDGRAFDPLAPAATELEKPFRERADGRMGLSLIRALMDQCRYRRDAGRNHLHLQKRFAAAL